MKNLFFRKRFQHIENRKKIVEPVVKKEDKKIYNIKSKDVLDNKRDFTKTELDKKEEVVKEIIENLVENNVNNIEEKENVDIKEVENTDMEAEKTEKPQKKTSKNNGKKRKKKDMISEEQITSAEAQVENLVGNSVKRVKKDRGLIERVESSKIILTEDNRQVLND